MIDPLYRIGSTDRTPSATDAAREKAPGGAGAPSARGSRFAALLYGMLKPPVLDLSDASGDDEDDAPRPPMKAHVQPNLAKLMREIDPNARPFASAHAAATTAAPGPGRGPKDAG